MTRSWISRGVGALVFVVVGAGCDRDATTPSPSGSDLALATNEVRAPQTPEEAIAELEQAYNTRSAKALGPLFGGRYVFHASSGEWPESFNRAQVLASLRSLYERRDVESVTLDIEAGPAEPADDPAFPGAMRMNGSVVLEVVMTGPGGEPIVLLVDHDPVQFYLAKGPSYSSTVAGWQIVQQWDLVDELERPTTGTSWSEVIALFLPKPNDEASQ